MIISQTQADARLSDPSNPFAAHKKDTADWGRPDKQPSSSAFPSVSPSSKDSPSSRPEDTDSPDPSRTPDTSDAAQPRDTVEDTGPSKESISYLKSLMDVAPPQASRVRASNGKNLKGQTEIQQAIGQTSVILGPTATGHLYDKSHDQADAYANARSSTALVYGKTKQPERADLKQGIDRVKQTLADLASQKLERTLRALTDEKLDKMQRPTNISRVARDLSTVLEKATSDNHKEQGIHFHLYRPGVKGVSDYKVIDVGVSEVPAGYGPEIPTVVTD